MEFYTSAYDSSILSNGTKLARIMERPTYFETISHEQEQAFTNIWAYGLAEPRCFFRMAKWLITVEDQLCESKVSGLMWEINEALTLCRCGYALFMKVDIKKQVFAFSVNPIEKFDGPFAIDNNPSHVPAMRYLLMILGILLIEYSQSYKILIYAPKIMHSHFNFMGHIADALVTAGHEVVFYTPAYDSSILSNGTKLARVMERRSDFETLSRLREQAFTNIWAYGLAELRCSLSMAKWLRTVEDQLCESKNKYSNEELISGQMSDLQLINKLKGERFDVGINEALTGCGYALFMKVGIKKQVSVFSINPVEKIDEPFAIDNNPSHVPGAPLI
ncbi:unnamed protein product [Anisakis simplex]|uniref:glucuronosyltransferase n=1 Tax=Anisakis simplex TaxID=6269 RepID=A0A0M3K8M9_ANISI|nr:unnamed protein product [Anisakis simplex]